MTAVATLAGAPTDGVVDWASINWQKVNRNVRRLQARIVKAVEAGRWNKVKALQHLLTHSFSGKALAVKRVTENKGKRTAGVDGEIWDTPKKKARGVTRLRQRGYRAQPLRRVYIPKPGKVEKRGLSIPTMKDRAMQALYLLALDPIAETTGDRNSYGFRRERSPADAIAQCFLCFRQKTSPAFILEADIRACFDEINHDWLLTHAPMDKHILKQWLKAGYIERKTFCHTEEGTPQGGIASPVLANLTLDGLEAFIDCLPHRGTKRQAKLHLVRFADDFIITGSSQDLLTEDIQPVIIAFLAERGLALSMKKTRLTHIDDGFDFLGQNIRKYKGKLLIKPSAKSIKRFLHKVRTIIKTNPTISAGELIAWLNPVIRGWANYHRHVVSKKVFSRVDHLIHQALWQWARRRHRDKGAHWIRAKYFAPDWAFRGTKQGRDGKHKTITLVKTARIPIRRHVKVRAAANPYHPQWEHYFEKRRERTMSDYLSANPVVLRLWLKQNGICPMCNTPISKETGWENHHIKWRVYGGSDRMDNRVLLHPTCHRQVHSLGLTVLQPRPVKGALAAA